MKERVVVALSGGVDSGVAAALLKKQGYEVIGITMCFGLSNFNKKKPSCCGIQGIEDARRICHKLGIRHYVLNMQKDLERWVIRDFCQEYLKGRTPNPCVRCNQYLKFSVLLKKALCLGAKYLATGHYARIEEAQSAKRKAQNYLLKKAKDFKKDQSYFLYRLSQRQLKHILFPLGDYTKDEVRKMAREFDLPVADKLASQEICFLPDADYRKFLKHRFTPPFLTRESFEGAERAGLTQISTDIKTGPVIDKQGNILGQHKGIAFYTIGQREGLGIAAGYPLYINKINSRNNTISVGKKEDVYGREFLVEEPHFILRHLKKKVALKVKIRYNHKESKAEVSPFGNKIKVRFKTPQFAITPGQSAVFYDKDIVLGGGIIQKPLLLK